MATLQKLKILDEQEQIYNRTGKVNEQAIQQAGITQLDYQQYEASKREYQETGQVDFTKYTSDPAKGIYGGVDINQFDKDALDLMRTAWKDSYTTSADKGKAYDMSDPDDVQNMLSGRMSKAVSSTYDIDEMSQWLYQQGLPNSQYFGGMYNAALEEVAEQRRLTENDKAFDSAVMNALMEQSKAGVVIDDKAVREAIIDVRATDPEKYDEVEERLYKETGLLASKSAGYLAEAQGMNAQLAETAQKANESTWLRTALNALSTQPAGLQSAGTVYIPLHDREPQEETPDTRPPEVNAREQMAADIIAEVVQRYDVPPEPRKITTLDEANAAITEQRKYERPGMSIGESMAAKQENEQQEVGANAAQEAFDALYAAGYGSYEAAVLLEQNGIPYSGTEIYKEREAQRRARQEEGTEYLKQRLVETGLEDAWKVFNFVPHPEMVGADDYEATRTQTATEVLSLRDELTGLGLSPLEADNVIAISGLGKGLDARQTAEDYERYILGLYGLDEAAINDYIASLTDEEWEQRVKDLKFNDMVETGTYEQTGRTAIAIPMRFVLKLASDAVGFADMATGIGSDRDAWGATKYLIQKSEDWRAYGYDVNHRVLSYASDIGSEILRIYAVSAAGSALGGLTAEGTSKLLATAATKAPFVASAMGGYFNQAMAGGAERGDATLYALGAGTVEGLLESLAVGEAMEHTFASRIMTKTVQKAATPKNWRMLIAKYGAPLVGVGIAGIGEFAEESTSEIISGWLRRATWDKTYRTEAEDVWEAGAVGAVIGVILGGLGAPAASRRYQLSSAMLDAQADSFGADFDNLVAATVAESLKPETLQSMQLDAAMISKPEVADLIAEVNKNNAHLGLEDKRYQLRMEKLDSDAEKAREKANRLVLQFKALDPNSATHTKDWATLRGQIDSAKANYAQIKTSAEAQKQAAMEEHAALVSRLQNDVARTSDKLTRHFVARDAAARVAEAPETGIPATVEQPAEPDIAQPGIQDLGTNTSADQDGIVEYAVSPQFREAAAGLRRLGRRGYRALVDGSAELGNVTKAQKQAQSGTAPADAMVQMYRNAGGTVDYLLDVEQVDAYGNPTGLKSYRELWESFPDIDGETANLYLLHRHNIDRMAQGKPIFANEDGSPVTAEQSRAIIMQMAQENPSLPQLASEVKQWHRRFMRDFVVGDLLTEADFSKLLNMYPDYVPTFRKKYEDKPRDTSSSRGTTVSINQPIKTATGATSEVRDIRDSFADGYNAMVRARRKNDLLLNLYQFALDHPNAAAPYAQIIGKPAKDSAMPVYDDIMAEAFLEARNGDYIVRARKGGEWVEMGVSKDVFDSINDLFSRQYNEFTEDAVAVGRKLTGWQKALITGYNPFFAMRNFARDTQTAFVNDESINPIKLVESLARAAKMMAEDAPEFKKFKALGGDRSGFFKANEGFIRSAKFDRADTMGKKALNRLGDWSAAGGEYTETLNRFATALRHVDKQGSTDADWQQAMLASAEGTTNFSRSGPLAKTADAWLIYLNANIQGTDKVLRQVKNHPARTLSKTAGIALAGVLLGHLAGNDENEHYQNLGWRIKDNYFCIPNIFGERDSLGYCTTFIRIPKAQGYATIIAAFQRAALMVTQDKSFNEAYDNFLGSAWESLSISPSTPISAIIEASRNESWSGTTIEPAYMEDRAIADRYDSSTSRIALNLAKMLERMGLSYETMDWLGASPKKIDYVLDQMTGAAGDVVLPATAVGNDSVESTLKSAGDIIGRQFVADPLFSNDIVSKFYEAGAEIEIERRQAYDERTAAMQGDEFKGRAELKFTAYNKAKGELSDSYKRERRILKKYTNSKQRDEYVKAERRKRLRIIEAFNQHWGE